VVGSHGGTIAATLDGLGLAVFGVPARHEDDALRAARAALQLAAEASELGLRCAIDTGTVLAADAASTTGPVMRSARELLTLAHASEVLLAAGTYELLRGAVRVHRRAPGVLVLDGLTDAARPRRRDATLVGRGRQLRALTEAFADAVERRRCQVVTLV